MQQPLVASARRVNWTMGIKSQATERGTTQRGAFGARASVQWYLPSTNHPPRLQTKSSRQMQFNIYT